MCSDSVWERLVGLVYDAALGQRPWEAFTEALAETVGARNTHFLIVQDRGRTHHLLGAARSDPGLQRAYVEHYARVNPYPQHPQANATPGQIHSGEWIPKSEIQRTEFYNDFLVKSGVYPVLVANLLADAQGMAFLATYRPLHGEPFGDSERALLTALLAHARRALHVSGLLGQVETERSRWMSTLDLLDHGLILLGDDGRPLFLNKKAERHLEPEDGLALRLDGLRASYPEDTRALRALIARCLPGATYTASGGHLSLRRPSGRRPLTIVAVPLARGSASQVAFLQAARTPAVLLFVTEPGRSLDAGVPDTLLSAVFDLTPREAQLARLLSRGMPVTEAARQLGVSFHTARVHQRRVYEKVAVHSQAELVCVLDRLRAPLSASQD